MTPLPQYLAYKCPGTTPFLNFLDLPLLKISKLHKEAKVTFKSAKFGKSTIILIDLSFLAFALVYFTFSLYFSRKCVC